MTAMRVDVSFRSLDGTSLHGWFYPARTAAPAPGVVLTHGFTATIDMGLEPYALAFQAAGMACLVYDHRGFGLSAGLPRDEADPWRQVSDMRDAVTFLSGLKGVDAARVGLWGTSYSGGHVLVVAATDRRVRCVVSQVPVVSGWGNMTRMMPAPEMPAFLQAIAAERSARMLGAAPRKIAIAQPGSETHQWAAMASGGTFRNEVTLLSRDMFMSYEPGAYIPRISPTPLLMIVATADTRTPTDEQLQAYARALEPRRLRLVDCGHYDPYVDTHPSFAICRDEATAWLRQHLEVRDGA